MTREKSTLLTHRIIQRLCVVTCDEDDDCSVGEVCVHARVCMDVLS